MIVHFGPRLIEFKLILVDYFLPRLADELFTAEKNQLQSGLPCTGTNVMGLWHELRSIFICLHATTGALGKEKKKVAPRLGADLAQIRPPWRTIMRLTVASPIPVPGNLELKQFILPVHVSMLVRPTSLSPEGLSLCLLSR